MPPPNSQRINKSQDFDGIFVPVPYVLQMYLIASIYRKSKTNISYTDDCLYRFLVFGTVLRTCCEKYAKKVEYVM